MKLTVVIEKDEHGYFVYCPVLKGCMSQGETYEEALANIKEAIELYLGTLSEEEIRELSKREIHTSTIEVQVA
ncbi:MAG: type II toxin-antitoxin system HicB family antitoxin [Thermodesulfovibrio sp.]|nr:type II toxin-antitoxin system HicB family antitoxin [Thermodesulfovibrio sp.]